MKFFPLKIWIFFCLYALAPKIAAQPVPEDFRRIADNLIERGPRTYEEFSDALLPYQQDTLMMLYFARQCEIRGFQDGLAYAYNQLGEQFRYMAEFDRAIQNHEKSLEAAKKANNYELRINSLNRLGEAYMKKESIGASFDSYQEALNIAESISDPSNAIQAERNTALTGIGDIYKLLQQWDMAIQYFEESLKNAIKIDEQTGQAINYQRIAYCLEAKEELEPAMRYYEKSQAVNKVLGSRQIDILNIHGMAHVLTHQDQAEKALHLQESILSDAEALGDEDIRSSIYIQLGWIFTKLGEYQKAKNNLFKGLAIAESIPLYTNIYQANTWLHDIYEAEGDYKQALSYFEKAIAARNRYSNDPTRQYVIETISNSEAEKRQNLIDMLAKENELVSLQLRRNRITLLAGALLVVLFALILYILYRQNQINSEKKVLALEQNMLRSQMNPHFLFNSLNSIKLYIINNEQKNAVHYLNKFSKLVRKILEASSLREIPLQEELDTVELYMNIENIRFNNEVDFAIDIGPDIDTSLVKTPSLILQPFLENALWHGLSSKEGEKIIRIEVKRAGPGYIEIIIRDNGIGRKAAEQIRDNRLLKRDSMGIAITKERLANFSKTLQNTCDVYMEDLFHPNGTPAGTQVTLRISTV